jgi:hypothetical protein
VAPTPEVGAVVILPQPREGVRPPRRMRTTCMMTTSVGVGIRGGAFSYYVIWASGVVVHVVEGRGKIAIRSEARAVLILPQPREGVRSARLPERGA